MKPLLSFFYLPLTTFFLSTQVYSEELLFQESAKFIEKPIELKESPLQEWILKIKNIVHNEKLLNPSGLAANTLIQQGNLSDEQLNLLSYYVEVRPLAGAQRVYVALFYNRHHMNKTLIRTSLFQDGGPGVIKGQVPTGHELFLHESLVAARGLNLKGSQIRTLMELSPPSNKPLWPEEKLFYKRILPQLDARHTDEDYFVIAVNVAGFSLDTLGHEVAHSLFDTLPAYKQIVMNFWYETVTAEDRQTITRLLGDIYDSETVIIDEFQAYLLQPSVPVAQSDRLKDFVPKYKRALLHELKSHSLPVPYEQADECQQILAGFGN